MEQFLKILRIICYIAAFHGIFLSIILIAKKQNNKANHILALIVLLFSVGITQLLYVSSGTYLKLWWLSPFYGGLPYTFGPLLYFYIRALTQSRFHFRRRDILHALPSIIFILLYSVIFFIPGINKSALLHKIYFETSVFSYISVVLSLTQALIYILLCLQLLKNHLIRIKGSYSELAKINLEWIRHLVILFILIWLIAVGLQSLLPEKMILEKLDDAVTYFLLSIFIFIIGYRGMSQPQIFTQEKTSSDNRQPHGHEPTKYEKSGLSGEKSEQYKKVLLGLMSEQKLYHDPGLTLAQVSEKSAIPPHHLSQVINDLMNQNFYMFVNRYRVREAVSRLKNAETSNDKLIKIAFDSGFNSLATFNRVFKKISGQSPSQFRKKFGIKKSEVPAKD